MPVHAEEGLQRLASLHSKDAFGQAEEGYLRELAPKYGLDLVAVEEFNPEDTNFTPQIVKLKAANPQLIYNGATGRPAILTFKLIQQMQITAPVAVQQASRQQGAVRRDRRARCSQWTADTKPDRCVRHSDRRRHRAAL